MKIKKYKDVYSNFYLIYFFFAVTEVLEWSKVISYETDEFPILEQRQTCIKKAFKLDSSDNPDDSFKITKNGEFVSLINKNNFVLPDQYCLEQFKSKNYNIAAILCGREGPTSNDLIYQ